MTIHETRAVVENGALLDDEVIAQWFPASPEAVQRVLAEPVGDDGRSAFAWVRLQDGTLILGVFPRGDGYFACEADVEADHKRASE